MSDKGQKGKGQAKAPGPKGDPREAAKAEKKAAKRENKSAGTQVAVGETAHDPNYVPRFKQRYNDVIRPELMKQFGYKNVHAGAAHREGGAQHRGRAKRRPTAKRSSRRRTI